MPSHWLAMDKHKSTILQTKRKKWEKKNAKIEKLKIVHTHTNAQAHSQHVHVMLCTLYMSNKEFPLTK